MQKVMEINSSIDFDKSVIELNADFNTSEKPLNANIEFGTRFGGNGDYLKLKNKPSINGEELIENYDEIDPTVPAWAKEPVKPEYEADDVGAVDIEDEMSVAMINSVWDAIFNN